MGLDLQPHPIKNKQLSAKQRAKIKSKIDARTATREEYKRYQWDQRFSKRRKAGINRFWSQERERIIQNKPLTRNWTPDQIDSILAKRSPRYQSKPLESHHTYSAIEYPHLANMGEVIYPATHDEHFKGWHGGNYKKSKPGKRIRRFREF